MVKIGSPAPPLPAPCLECWSRSCRHELRTLRAEWPEQMFGEKWSFWAAPAGRLRYIPQRASPIGWYRRRRYMKLTLHHINLCSTDVPAMDEFYRSVLGLVPEPSMQASRVMSQGYAGDVAFVTDGTTQVHLAERDLDVGFRTGQAAQSARAGPHCVSHRRHRRLQTAPGREGDPLCRLWRLCDERLGADFLPRSGRQRHRGPSGPVLTPIFAGRWN